MNRIAFQRAIRQIAWGYVFLCFNISFDLDGGKVEFLPAWAGYLLMFMALDTIAKWEPAASLLKPIGGILAAEAVIVWAAAFTGVEFELPWLTMLISILNLYFQFQLLTNLSDIAIRGNSDCGKRLRMLRTVQTVYLTLYGSVELFPENWTQWWLQGHLLIVGIVVAGQIAVVIGICVTLFSYSKEHQSLLNLPAHVKNVIAALEQQGHEAYAVGGCIRDLLMERQPSDWDICTSARPEETTACFGEAKTVQTGAKHGTVTVLTEGGPVEITTYRIDGDYLDGRHPEAVIFTPNLEEDLKRRDFTMNALAYNLERGLVDLHNGAYDIKHKMVRCVGEPQKRFEEDALRILRALRFRSVLCFQMDMETAKAVRSCAHLLTKISKERINGELSKLVLGPAVDTVIGSYYEVLRVCCPGLVPASVKKLPEELSLRLAVLFPEGTKEALRGLKYDNRTVEQAAAIARLLAAQPFLPQQQTQAQQALAQSICRMLKAEGEFVTRMYYAVFGEEASVKAVIDSGACWNLKQLAISGGDLIKLGAEPGPAIGSILDEMLELVIDEKLENSSDCLLDYARERGTL